MSRMLGAGWLVVLRILSLCAIGVVLFASSARADEVALEMSGSAYTVPVIINGAVKIKFVLDSGAGDIQLPADTVLTLIRSGTLSASDFIGSQSYTFADGKTLQSRKFTLHAVRVGNLVLQNVMAHVGAVTSPPLLGQSFLSRIGSWTIDNTRHVLVFAPAPGASQAVLPGPSPGNRSVSANKTAAAGVPLILNSATALRPDCSLIGLPVARVTQPPDHGKVALIHRDEFPNYRANDPHAACDTMRVPSLVVEYTSNPSFAGSDFAVVEYIFPDGKDVEVKFAITVK